MEVELILFYYALIEGTLSTISSRMTQKEGKNIFAQEEVKSAPLILPVTEKRALTP